MVSSISVWELALLVARGRLELNQPLEDWLRAAEAVKGFEFVPVNNRIAAASVLLAGYENPDPADRMILATAAALPAALVTRDQSMQAFAGVDTVW